MNIWGGIARLCVGIIPPGKLQYKKLWFWLQGLRGHLLVTHCQYGVPHRIGCLYDVMLHRKIVERVKNCCFN